TRGNQVAKQSPELLGALAVRLSDLGENAESLLKEAQKQHPGDFWVNFELGTVLMTLKKPTVQKLDEAVGYCRAALAVRPGNRSGHLALGNALSKIGKWEEAVDEYRYAIQLDSKYAPAHYNLGIALYRIGQWQEAIAEYRKAIQADPKFA